VQAASDAAEQRLEDITAEGERRGEPPQQGPPAPRSWAVGGDEACGADLGYTYAQTQALLMICRQTEARSAVASPERTPSSNIIERLEIGQSRVRRAHELEYAEARELKVDSSSWCLAGWCTPDSETVVRQDDPMRKGHGDE
jgi:hypothetical protein